MYFYYLHISGPFYLLITQTSFSYFLLLSQNTYLHNTLVAVDAAVLLDGLHVNNQIMCILALHQGHIKTICYPPLLIPYTFALDFVAQ